MNIQLSSKTVLAFINSEAAHPVVFDHNLFAENLHNGFHAKSIESASVHDDSVTFVCKSNVSAFGEPFTRLELVVPAESVLSLLNKQIAGAKHGGLIPEEKTIRLYTGIVRRPEIGTITSVVVESDAVIFVAVEKTLEDLERAAIEAGAFNKLPHRLRAQRQQENAPNSEPNK